MTCGFLQNLSKTTKLLSEMSVFLQVLNIIFVHMVPLDLYVNYITYLALNYIKNRKAVVGAIGCAFYKKTNHFGDIEPPY